MRSYRENELVKEMLNGIGINMNQALEKIRNKELEGLEHLDFAAQCINHVEPFLNIDEEICIRFYLNNELEVVFESKYIQYNKVVGEIKTLLNDYIFREDDINYFRIMFSNITEISRELLKEFNKIHIQVAPTK